MCLYHLPGRPGPVVVDTVDVPVDPGPAADRPVDDDEQSPLIGTVDART